MRTIIAGRWTLLSRRPRSRLRWPPPVPRPRGPRSKCSIPTRMPASRHSPSAGWPDLYVLNMQGDDHYYENQQGKKFLEKTETYFPKTPWGTMGIKFFDYDNDGKPDLLLTDMHSDMSEEIGPEREKLKSRMQWTDEFLQGGANNIFGNALYHDPGGGKG